MIRLSPEVDERFPGLTVLLVVLEGVEVKPKDPRLEEFKKAVEDESVSLLEALRRAAEAAEKGMKATIPMIAKRGRASYLGPRSIGHQDPGATSSYLIIKTMYDYVKELAEKSG